MAWFYLTLLLFMINVYTLNAHKYHEDCQRSLRESDMEDGIAKGSAQMKEDILHRIRRDTNQTNDELKPTTEAQLKSKKNQEHIKTEKVESLKLNKTKGQPKLNETKGQPKFEKTTESNSYETMTDSEEDRRIAKKWAELNAPARKRRKPTQQKWSNKKAQRTRNKTRVLNETGQPRVTQVQGNQSDDERNEELESLKEEINDAIKDEKKEELKKRNRKKEAELNELNKKEAELKAKKEEETKAKIKAALKRKKFFLNPKKEKELKNKIEGVKEETEKPKKRVEPKQEKELKTNQTLTINVTDPSKYSWSTIKQISREHPNLNTEFKFRSAMQRQMETLENQLDVVNLRAMRDKFKKAYDLQESFHKILFEASENKEPVTFTPLQIQHYQSVNKMRGYAKMMKEKGLPERLAVNRAADKMLEYWYKYVEELEKSTTIKPNN